MLIGFDGKRAIENFTGLGNYSRLLVEVLSERYPENEYLLYAPQLKRNTRMRKLMERRNVNIISPDPSFAPRISGSIWRTSRLTSRLINDSVDLYHGLSGELPSGITGLKKPTVLTIHDLIFRRFPAGYKAIDRMIYDRKFSRSAADATRIIAISQCTKDDIMDLYGIPDEKIDVVYQGCDPQFHRRPSDAEIEAVKRKYNIDGDYIITVGTIETRKNQMLTLRGMRGIGEELKLVIVGRRTPYAAQLDRYISYHHIDQRIIFIDNVEFADLPALYAGAYLSSYTSRYEGFGIPVIESLSVGTPVIVATGSCLEEAGGPATPAVDPDDVAEWVNVVKELIDYPSARDKIAREGMEYVKQFNNSNMAEQTMATYLRAISEFKG